MPRFLDTHTGEFVWLTDVGATPYAILSHTWRLAKDGGEQTYDDIVNLQRSVWKRIRNPLMLLRKFTIFSLPELSDKIKRACEVAREAGYRLIWIDSCCIDKRSSAELSEAINSMYALYRDADVCYVYLADVPKGTDPRKKYSKFWQSRWHKRGWTLQELVAPAHVVFLTCDWTSLGTKSGLASTLEDITGVDAMILLGVEPVESASVAKRMSWAAERKTTRVEDRAYSLLGIFGVHMSPIYGEGTNAFLRLQEEIIKHIPDQSIFAWDVSRTVVTLKKDPEAGKWYCESWDLGGSGLLAATPDAFGHFRDVTPITLADFATDIGRPHAIPPPRLHCIFTPQGARIELMTITHSPELLRRLVDEYSSSARCPKCREATASSPLRGVALLRCTDRDGRLIALPLRCSEEDVGAAENVMISIQESCGKWGHTSPRVLRLSAAVLTDPNVAPTCGEVTILRHSREPVEPKARRGGFSIHRGKWDDAMSQWYHDGKVPEIRLAPNCEEDLRRVGFTLTPLQLHQPHLDDPQSRRLILTTTLNIDSAREQRPHDDQDMHIPPILIELELRQQLGVELPPSRVISGHFAIESAPLVSLELAGVSSEHPLGDTSVTTSEMVVDTGRRSESFEIYDSSSRTIAEALFPILDCTTVRTGADGVSTLYVRLLSLKLDHPLESAYVKDCKYFSLSVELSERLIEKIPATDPESTGVSTTSSASECRADSSPLAQAAAETSNIQEGPSSGPGGTPSPRQDTIHDSPEPALSPTAISEQMAVFAEPGDPGPCDAEISVMHNGPDVNHTNGPAGVPSSPHESAQMAARESSLVCDTGSASFSASARRYCVYPRVDVNRIDAARPQGACDNLSTTTGGSLGSPPSLNTATTTPINASSE